MRYEYVMKTLTILVTVFSGTQVIALSIWRILIHEEEQIDRSVQVYSGESKSFVFFEYFT